MYKKDREKHVDYVYALYAKNEKGEKIIVVMNMTIPVFADKETAQDFHDQMVAGKIENEENISIEKVVLKKYDK